MSGASFLVEAEGRRAQADPRDPAFFQDPYAFYAALHEAAAGPPRFRWEDYGLLCFAGFDDVTALLRDKRFGRRPGLPERTDRIAAWWETERWSLLAIDPPEHTQIRGLVNRAFLSRQIEHLEPRIADLADALITDLVARRDRDGGPVDLLPGYAAPLPAIVIAELIGLPASTAPDLVGWSNRMVRMYMFAADAEERAAIEVDADGAAVAFVAFVIRYLHERRARPEADLLSHLLEARVDGEALSEGEIVATVILLLNAGHEATVHTTGNVVREVLTADHDPAVLFADAAATAATVEEGLRFDPPLHLFTRFALTDVVLDDGTRIAEGEQVGLMLGAANRDPRRFARPDVFDTGRADAGNVSFGSGIHFCIGAPLARLELQTSLRLLFERLPGLRLAGEARYRDAFHFHGLEHLPVTW